MRGRTVRRSRAPPERFPLVIRPAAASGGGAHPCCATGFGRSVDAVSRGGGAVDLGDLTTERAGRDDLDLRAP